MAYKTVPALTYFYDSYHTCITLENIPKQLPIDHKYTRMDADGNTRFRIVKTYVRQIQFDQFTSKSYIAAPTMYNAKIYTSDEDIISNILNDSVLSTKIKTIQQPINQTHLDLLKKNDRKIILRDKLWYNQYKHKLSSHYILDNLPKDPKFVFKWIYENFPSGSSRRVSVSGGYSGHQAWRRGLSSIPTVFTNNEETAMLFKLSFSDNIKIKFETCICLKELES
jgi:hypothetical protein